MESQLHAEKTLGVSQDSPSDPIIAYPLVSHPFNLKVCNLGKNKESDCKRPMSSK